jgi:hypothetical protein
VQVVDNLSEQAEEGGSQRVVETAHLRVGAIRGDEILEEVVRADAEEIELAAQAIEQERSGRHLDHRAHGHGVVEWNAAARQALLLVGDHGPDPAHFVQRRHHRNHQLEAAERRGPGGGADLTTEERFEPWVHPHGAVPEERVVFSWQPEIRNGLVAADVERADDDRSPVGFHDGPPVVLELLVL